MTNQTVLIAQDFLYAEHKVLTAVLKTYPRSECGLVLDIAKTAQYHSDKALADQAFQNIRNFNTVNAKALKLARKSR